MNSISKPRGHKEGRASFPTKSPYKILKNRYLKSQGREGRKDMRGRRGRRAPGSVLLFLLCPAPNARANVSREGTPPFHLRAQRTHSLFPFASPPSLPQKTKLPLSARNKLEGP
jgi:hypothetical protein